MLINIYASAPGFHATKEGGRRVILRYFLIYILKMILLIFILQMYSLYTYRVSQKKSAKLWEMVIWVKIKRKSRKILLQKRSVYEVSAILDFLQNIFYHQHFSTDLYETRFVCLN
jgi:hypothetical protein